MPPKKSKIPAWKRKGAMRKARAGYKTITTVGKSLSPLPQRYITKHKYADSVAVVAVGQFAQYQFNLNSVYDPNRTGVGHQPYGRDQFAALYNRYRVISCSYRVATIPSVEARVIQTACVPTNNTPPAIGNIWEIREQPRCKYIVQQPQADQKFVTGKVYLPSLMGRTKAQYMADDNYQAQVGATPTELALLNVYSGSITDSSVDGEVFYFNIEMEFTVEWFDVNPLPSS